MAKPSPNPPSVARHTATSDGAGVRAFREMAEAFFPGEPGDPLDDAVADQQDRRKEKRQQKRLRMRRGGPRLPLGPAGIVGDMIIGDFFDSFKPGFEDGNACFVASCSNPIAFQGYSARNNCTPSTGCIGLPSKPNEVHDTHWDAVAYNVGHVPTVSDLYNWRWCARWWTRPSIGTAYYTRYIDELAYPDLQNPGLGTRTIVVVHVFPQPGPGLAPVLQPGFADPAKPDEEGDELELVANPLRKRFVRMTIVGSDTKPWAPPRRIVRPAPRPAPAKGRDNETKVQFSNNKIYRLVMGAIDAYTESGDLIGAFYKAIPKQYRCGSWVTRNGKPRWQPARYTCKRFDYACQAAASADAISKNLVNPGDVLLNVAANQFEDEVIGRANKAHLDLTGGRGSGVDYTKFKMQQQAFKNNQKAIGQMAKNKECR